MKDFTQWTLWRVISLIPIKKKKNKHVNEEGQDQQPEATMNASCKLFHCSHTALLYVAVCSSSQLLDHMYSWQVPPPLRRTRGAWRPAPLPALLLGGLFQCALRGGRALEPLGGDGGLVRHALPHHVAFPPQCDFLYGDLINWLITKIGEDNSN